MSLLIQYTYILIDTRTIQAQFMSLNFFFCVYHPGVFFKLNKISQIQSNTPFVFISLL